MMDLLKEIQRQENLLKDANVQGRVIGLKDVTGKFLDRVDIDEMLTKSPKTFNLFLLALEYLQDEKTSRNDKMSYFQIAGIHGLPQEWWDNVTVPREDEKAPHGSYCPHGQILFPTWHRPYLAMMEQSLYYQILHISQKFKDPEYHSAALEFRLPYWDYFRPRGGRSRFPGVSNLKTGATTFPYDFSVPHILEVDEVMVVRPGSEDVPEVMDNPLYQYHYPKKSSVPAVEWDKLWQQDQEINPKTGKPDFNWQVSRSRTVRQSTNYNNQKSDYLTFNSVLAQSRESAVEMMLSLLSLKEYKEYYEFSHARGRKGLYGSVESLHNRYHNICGGEGHMSRVPVAAFDPIFWLHHVNIDRILAIWQAINPDYKFPGKKELAALHVKETENDPLYPFRAPADAEDPYWTSKTVRKVEDFGYTYAEIQANKNPEALLRTVFENYLWSLQQFLDTQKIPDSMEPFDVFDAPVYSYNDRELASMLSRDPTLNRKIDGVDPINNHTPHIRTSTVDNRIMSASSIVLGALKQSVADEVVVVKEPSLEVGEHRKERLQLSEGLPNKSDSELLEKSSKSENTRIIRQWFVDSLVGRSALNGAFTIYYFIGEPPSDFENYELAPTLAGLEHIFVAPEAVCDNCGRDGAHRVEAANTSPITAILLDYVRNRKLQTLYPENVVPFLRANLHWRVVAINRRSIPNDQVRGLTVSVSSAVSYYDPDTVVPEFIGGLTYPEVTVDRVGGVKEGGT